MVELKDVPVYVSVLVLAGILAGAGILMNDALIDSTNTIEYFDVANESITADNSTGTALTNVTHAVSVTVTNVRNSTKDCIIEAANYTTAAANTHNGGAITITLTPPYGNEWNGQTIYVDYTYGIRNTEFSVIENSSIGVANITEQFPTVGIVFGVGLIVSVVVLLFFAFKGRTY